MSPLRIGFSMLAALLALALAPIPAMASDSKPDESKLDNGLTVLVRKMKVPKGIGIVVVYRIGLDQDPAGRRGLAVLLDHLYGTCAAGKALTRTALAVQQAYRQGLEWGAGGDYSSFGGIVTPGEVSVELEEAAARMSDLKVEESDLEREKVRLEEAIGNEYGGMERAASRNLARLGLIECPRKGRLWGHAEEIRATTLAEAHERLARYYKPANAILSIAGDIEVAAAKALAKKWFSKIPAGEAAPPAGPMEGLDLTPELTAAGDGVAVFKTKPTAEAPKTAACLAFAAPAAGPTKDFAAFLVLASRLMDRSFARGMRQVAPGTVRVRYDLLRDSRAIYLVSEPAPEPPTASIDALRAEWQDAAAAPVAAKDFASAQNEFNASMGLPLTIGTANDALGSAFGDARRKQLGLDGEAVMKLVAAVKTADVKALVAATVSRAVVVNPR